MAERAIRQLAVQRKISNTFSKRVAPQYLLLLAISQTCRFQGKSFLKFLLSKETDLDSFRRTRPIRYSYAVGRQRVIVGFGLEGRNYSVRWEPPERLRHESVAGPARAG